MIRLVAVSSDNRIYTAWSEEMLFKVYEPDGTYQRAIYHPFENTALNRSEALNYYDNEVFKKAMQNEGIPEYWRAFEHFLIDDKNHLWISTITDDREVFRWWFMNSVGDLLAKFDWPQRKEINKVKDGFAYALETEEETGPQEVTKYRIQWDEKAK